MFQSIRWLINNSTFDALYEIVVLKHISKDLYEIIIMIRKAFVQEYRSKFSRTAIFFLCRFFFCFFLLTLRLNFALQCKIQGEIMYSSHANHAKHPAFCIEYKCYNARFLPHLRFKPDENRINILCERGREKKRVCNCWLWRRSVHTK